MKFAALGAILIAPIIFIILGIMVKYKKAYWLISGYNTMSEEKKRNVDVVGLSGLIGSFCFLLAAITALATVLMLLDKTALGLVMFMLIIPLSIYMIIKSQKYDGNTRTADGTMNKKTKVMLWAISTFLVMIFIGLGVLFYQGSKPAEFIVADGQLEIKGLYGEKINLHDVREISLEENLPKVEFRTNGSALGSKLKGHFRLKEIGAAKLLLDASKPPFIYLQRDPKPLIFNCDNEQKTRELFAALKAERERVKN